jgi:hypothetical protein
MYFYQWWKAELTIGLPISAPVGYPQLFLGQNGDDRRYGFVPLDRYHPPRLDDGLLLEADLRRTTVAMPEWVFVDAATPTKTVGIRIRTDWRVKRCNPKRCSPGQCRASSGKPVLVGDGSGMYGARGCSASSDSLYVLQPGDQIQVIPQHSGHRGFWIVGNNDGQPFTERLGLPPRMVALHNRPLAFV